MNKLTKCVKSFLIVFLSCFSLMSTAQTLTISGTVKDDTGEILPGVSIRVQGSSAGTVSSVDGSYSVTVPNAQSVLEFSFIGFTTEEVVVGNRRVIDVILKDAASALDEVVVIGYGTVKKRDLTGAVAQVKAEEIALAPTTNVMEALQGRVSGLDITRGSGSVNSGVSITLRGTRSIYGSNSPLFIIDGAPGSYDQLNSSDVETIDVLKDASATAIYGSAGSNGVIIITTKRGRAGRPRINFDAYYGFSGQPEYRYPMMGDEWTEYQKEAYRYQTGYPSSQNVDMEAILTNPEDLDFYKKGKWIDWVGELTGRTATTQRYNFSVASGTDKTRMFTSLMYTDDTGLIDNESRTRYQVRSNIEQELFPWARIGMNTLLSYTISNDGESSNFTQALGAFPLGNAYDEEGNIVFWYAPDRKSPLGDRIPLMYVNETRRTYILPSAFLELTPYKGFTLRSVVSATLNSSRLGRFYGSVGAANEPSYATRPHASISNSYRYGYMWENILTYNALIANAHSITATLVSSWEKNQSESNLNSGSGQDLDLWSFYRLNSAPGKYTSSGFSQTQQLSYAGRVNYSYLGKYLLAASVRYDGVSWLSKGHKWDYFPAVSAAWRISDESFMESSKSYLNDMKLRVGYGVTGNAGGVGAYSTNSTPYGYTSAGISINGEIAAFTQYTGTYANPGLGWEKSSSLNVGMDFSFLKNRVDLTVEWYSIQTKDLLFRRMMPVTSGALGWGAPLNSWENIAETSNKGFEFMVNSRNFVKKGFTWNTTFNFTFAKERIESLPSGDLISESLFVGYPISSIYNYKYAGIWGTDASQADRDTYGVSPGFVKIETVPIVNENGVSDNGRHRYSTNDRQILGHRHPSYLLGLNNSLTYKGFDLNVFAMSRLGMTFNSSLHGWYSAARAGGNNQLAGTDYWTENNQSARYPRPGTGPDQIVMQALRIFDGSYAKIKNITLGYTLPKNISQVALMDKFRVYATIYNPLIWTKEKELRGTDPEQNGLEGFPTYKQFVFGINITF